MVRSSSWAITGGVLAVLAALAGVPAAADSDQLSEVIVTAQRRQENLQSVPVSATVFSAAEIEQAQAISVRDLADKIPNFSYTDTTSLSNPFITIRGIFSNVYNAGVESGFGSYIDGVYTGRTAAFDSDTADIAQIEVLRGPQGTLFGKNTTAGAINITTIQPSSTPTGSAELDFGNYRYVRAKASYSGPLTDDLDFRVSAFRTSRDPTTENPGGPGFDDRDATGGRIQLLYHPTDRLSVYLAADAEVNRTLGDVQQALLDGYTPLFGLPATTLANSTPYVDDTDSPHHEDRDLYGTQLNVVYETPGGGKITSITAYRSSKFGNEFDFDGINSDKLAALTGGFTFAATENDREKSEQESQEFRYASPIGGALDYVAGAYFLHVNTNEHDRVDFTNGTIFNAAFGIPLSATGPDGLTGAVGPDAAILTNSYALFGQGNYHAGDRLTLTAGARYTYETRSANYIAHADPLLANLGITPFGPLPLDKSEGAFSPMAAAEFKWTENVLTYAKVTRGFKAGGFNLAYQTSASNIGNANQLLAFGPETVTAYEIGAKNELFDHRARANLALFYSNYRDLQTRETYSSGFGQIDIIRNVGGAHIKGAELDAEWLPLPGLDLSAGFGYTHAQIVTSFLDENGVDYDGHLLQRVPKYTANVAADYRFNAGRLLDLELHGQWSHTEGYFNDNSDTVTVPSLDTVNAALSFLPPSARTWEVSLWVHNLTNQNHITSYGPNTETLFGTPQPFAAFETPRTYGVHLRYSF
ncbi:MAG TPA: TonB-dependent receptor [Steroidobacteraceae bacterium]|nr:TonB-dependent receptor [Steroidobacteraceae bacterium]